MARYRDGDPNQRLRQLYAATDRDRWNPEIRMRLAQTLDRLGRESDALGEYQMAATLFLQRGLARKALAVYRLLRTRLPDDASVRKALEEAEERVLTEDTPAPVPQLGREHGGERRRTPRIPWPDHVLIWATALRPSRFTGQKIFVVRGRDVSTNGLAADTAHSLRVGAYMELELHHPALRDPGRIRAHVARPVDPKGSLGISLDWVDAPTMRYLVSSVARQHRISIGDVERLHEEALYTPAFDFADWSL